MCVLLLGFGWFVLIVWIGYAMRGQSRLFILFFGVIIIVLLLLLVFVGMCFGFGFGLY